MNHTMMRQAALVLTVVGGLSCARQVTPEAKADAAAAPTKTVAVEEPATLPDDHHLAKLELPLFSPDA